MKRYKPLLDLDAWMTLGVVIGAVGGWFIGGWVADNGGQVFGVGIGSLLGKIVAGATYKHSD